MENKYVEYYPVVNAIIQVAAIFMATTFGNYIGMYIVMAFMTFITITMVISSAYTLTTKSQLPETIEVTKPTRKTTYLIYVFYLASCYVIYAIGYPFLAGAYVTGITVLALHRLMEAISD